MFCSKCGREVLSDSRFCPQCGNMIAHDVGTAYVENNYVQPFSSEELPSSEHHKAFQKWFGVGCVSVFIGCVAGFIGCFAVSVLNGKYFKDTQYSSALGMFIILGVLGLLAGLVLLAMALNIRLKPQPTRTMLRYGTRFVELALSFTNLGHIAFLASYHVFGGMVNEGNGVAEIMGWLVAAYVGIIEIIVGFVRKKYKSDGKYTNVNAPNVVKEKVEPARSKQEKPVAVTTAASERDMEKCHTALNKFEEINSGVRYSVPVWKCKHCGCENPNTSDECKSCGRYK